MIDLYQLEEGAARRAAAIAAAAERARSLQADPPARRPLAAWLARLSFAPPRAVARLAAAVPRGGPARPGCCPA